MQAITAYVKGSPRQVKTKYGDRSVLDVTLPTGEVTAVWGPANHQPITGRRNGERVLLGQETNGKLHILETASSGLASPKEVTNQPLATQSVSTSVATAVTPIKVNASPSDAIDTLISRYASIMNKCRFQIINQMNLENEEIIERYAVSLFIQTTKALADF